MVDSILSGGVVATIDEQRRVLDPGSVAIDGTDIVAVGEPDEIRDAYEADRVIDASGHVVIPGLVNTHVHVPDILYRGRGKARGLHDWLFNVKHPFLGAMESEDHALAAELYCRESLRSGITTFVENAGGLGNGYDAETIEAKLSVYDEAGLRNVYAHGFLDSGSDTAFESFVETQRRKEPDVVHATEPPMETAAALDRVESLIEEYHAPDDRQSVWPGPFLAGQSGRPRRRVRYRRASRRHDDDPHRRESGSGAQLGDQRRVPGEWGVPRRTNAARSLCPGRRRRHSSTRSH
jgi:cytosine/adenosine deaminase-related metal-dependent hydrolase